MNRPNAHVVEANIPSAAAPTPEQFGSGIYTAKQRREMEDLTAWMAEQDEAEVEFLIAEMAIKNSRAYRYSMNI